MLKLLYQPKMETAIIVIMIEAGGSFELSSLVWFKDVKMEADDVD
jgi:uncharacterized protein (UPF0248 family)